MRIHVQRPVGADDTFEAQLVAQVTQRIRVIINSSVVETIAVIEHDGRGLALLHSSLPRHHVVLPKLRVRAGVGKTVTSATGDIVLGHGVQTVFLISQRLRHNHLGDVIHFVAVPGADFHAVAVEDRRVAHRRHFLGILGNHVVEQLRIMRHAEGIVWHVDHGTEGVVWAVGFKGDRNAQRGALADSLNGIEHILLLLGRARGGIGIVRDMVLVDFVPHRAIRDVVAQRDMVFLTVQPLVLHRINGRESAAGKVVRQIAQLHVDVHLGNQIGDARVNIVAPVLVDIQRTVLIEILEIQAISLNKETLVLSAQFHLFAIRFDVVESGRALLDDRLLGEGRDANRGEQHCNREKQRDFLLHTGMLSFLKPSVIVQHEYRFLMSSSMHTAP